MEREKGAAVAACAGCGSELSLLFLADGSTAASACGTCYPSFGTAARTQAQEESKATTPAPSLFGTRERGSQTEDEDKEQNDE